MNWTNAQLLDAARVAADRAAPFLRESQGKLTESQWESKGHADFVTEIDREAERMITADLTAAVPDSIVVGEESSPSSLSDAPRTTHDARVLWIVDPLDGTTNYLHNLNVYAVSIAAVVAGELAAGIVHHAPFDQRYTAIKGGGAYLDGKRIAVSKRTEIKHALIGTGTPYTDMTQWPAYHRHIEAISRESAGIRRPGSAALDLCDVAAGRTDGFWEIKLAPWDIAAGTLIVREAGGIVTDFTGSPDVLKHGSVVAGNPSIHLWLMKTLMAEG